MSKAKSILVQRTEANPNPSEFGVTEIGKETIKIKNLLKTCRKLSLKRGIQKQLENLKTLNVPLEKAQYKKIERSVAYAKICDEVSKWEPVVNNNRCAEQLIFPLKKPDLQLERFESVAEKYHTKHPVEVAVSELLSKSESAMSYEQAKVCHQALMKHKAIISRQQAEARRKNKIKSKRYRRVLRKDKLKKLEIEYKELKHKDPVRAFEKLKEADNLRIMERMTLKHANSRKLAKLKKLRAKDPEVRSVLKEAKNIGQQCRNIVRESNDVTFHLKKEEQSVSDHISDDNQCGEKSLINDFGEKMNLKVNKTTTSTGMVSGFIDMDLLSETTKLDSCIPFSVGIGSEFDEVDDDEGGEVVEGVKSINEAFADDDLIKEFREDKKVAEEANKVKGINLSLPGWGSWSGPGFKQPKRKRKQKPLEQPAVKKQTLGNVIINEDKDKKAAIHQVNHVCFPFAHSAQFESYIRQPCGHNWNPVSSYRKLNAPKVVTKAGKIIEPIDSKEVEN